MTRWNQIWKTHLLTINLIKNIKSPSTYRFKISTNIEITYIYFKRCQSLVETQSHFSLKKFPLYSFLWFSANPVCVHTNSFSCQTLICLELHSTLPLIYCACCLCKNYLPNMVSWVFFFFTSSLPLFTFFLTRPVYCPWRGPGKTNVKIFL